MAIAQQPLDDLRGDHLSLKMFGAKGDTQVGSVATTSGSPIITYVGGATFGSGDVGKRIVIYGAAASGRETHLVSEVVGTASSASTTVALTIDSMGVGTKIGFAGNCFQNGVTWQVFGSNSAVFSGEVSVHGPTALTPLATSDSYIETPPTFRYYRIKIVSTGVGSGTFYGTAVVWGFVLGATLIGVSPVTMSVNADNTVPAAPCYFGTDDTTVRDSECDRSDS